MQQTLPQAKHANLHFVTPTLAIGGDIDGYDADLAGMQLAEIDALGITHVVDVRIEWNDADAFAFALPHIGYLHHGMDDAGQEVPAEWFERAITWIEAAGPVAVVLTHCHMGINRGPSLGFAVLLARDGNRSRRSAPSGRPARRPTSGTPPTRSPGTTSAPAPMRRRRGASTPSWPPGAKQTRSMSCD